MGVHIRPGIINDNASLGHTKIWFAKPRMIRLLADRFSRVLWIDADALVLKDIAPLLKMLDSGPVSTYDYFARTAGRNDPEIYKRFPAEPDVRVCVNAGVMGLDLHRDRALLEKWNELCESAASDPAIEVLLRNGDQGALIWAIEAMELGHRVLCDMEWNYPARGLRLSGSHDAMLAQARGAYPNASILHWMGGPKWWHPA